MYMMCAYLILHSDMYLAAGEFIKAIEIMSQNGWVERYMYIPSTILSPMHTHMYTV